MNGKIIVGLDGSPRQPDVLERAVELARIMKAELVLCRAITIPREVPASLWAFAGDELAKVLVARSRDELERIRTELDPQLSSRIEVLVGQPADVLCTIAQEEHADLVVIGSHGYGGIDRLLGTTAGKVANRAPCSVLVVRQHATA